MLTGVRIEIEGSSISLLATDRFRLSLRELQWDPGATDVSAAALVPAKVLADTAKSLTSGTEVTIALASSGAGEGIIGFEGASGGGVRRTTTRLLDGEFPKVRTLFPAEHATVARVDRATLVESVKRVSLVAERNTAVQLAFAEGVLTLDAGSGDEALATEQIEAAVTGEDITTGFNPQFLLDGLTAIEDPVVELAFTQASKPAVMSGRRQPRRRRGRRLPLPADAAHVCSPEQASTPVWSGCEPRHSPRTGADMDLGLIGLGKMGGNMRERIRRAGHTVVGYDRNPDVSDVDSLEAMVEAAALPEGRLGDGARPATRPARPSKALKELLGEGDVVVDGGNSRWTDDQANAELLADKGIGFVDCGVSGGVWGLENGYALMAGGDAENIEHRPADLRRAQARGRVRLGARRQGRRRALLEDGPQRHRVRHHAVLRRGLGAAPGGRRGRQRHRGVPLLARGHGHPVLAARPAGRRARRRRHAGEDRRLRRGLRRGPLDRRGRHRPRRRRPRRSPRRSTPGSSPARTTAPR